MSKFLVLTLSSYEDGLGSSRRQRWVESLSRKETIVRSTHALRRKNTAATSEISSPLFSFHSVLRSLTAAQSPYSQDSYRGMRKRYSSSLDYNNFYYFTKYLWRNSHLQLTISESLHFRLPTRWRYLTGFFCLDYPQSLEAYEVWGSY